MPSSLRVLSLQFQAQRPEQQDRAVLLCPCGAGRRAFAAVLDGIGSTVAGGEAADRGAQALLLSFVRYAADRRAPAAEVVARGLKCAALSVRMLRRSYAERGIEEARLPASTVVSAVLDPDGGVAVGHAGDSVAVLLTRSLGVTKAHLLTVPHTGDTDPVWQGLHPESGGEWLTRYLGREEAELQPEVGVGSLGPGERLLLATDGAWSVLESHGGWDRPEECLRDCRRSLDDNATLLILEIPEDAILEAPSHATDDSRLSGGRGAGAHRPVAGVRGDLRGERPPGGSETGEQRRDREA